MNILIKFNIIKDYILSYSFIKYWCKIKIISKILLIIIFAVNVHFAQEEEKIEIGIDEKLGDFLPLDAEITNINSTKEKLEDVIQKPTLLAFVYYECPGICDNTLSELAWVVDRVELEPEEDFQVLTISIDHEETPEIAKRAKENYTSMLKRKFPENIWKFFVTDSMNVQKLTSSVGYYFKKYGDEYRHPGGIITISPKGKISRYIFGNQYNQFDIKMALLDAEAGKTNPTIAKMLQFCFTYNPEGRNYSLNITRIVGSVMLLGIGAFILILFISNKKKKRNKKSDNS